MTGQGGAKIELLHGDVLDLLPRLAQEIASGERLPVQCVMTSPPYWGLRDYGLEPSIWDGEGGCDHVWGGVVPGDPRGGSDPNAKEFYAGDGKTTYARQVARGQFCSLCGAWRGCLGLEPTPELYVAHLVHIFRLVRDTMAEDGVLWLNLGDSYAGSWGNYGAREGKQRSRIAERWHRPAYEDKRHGWDGLPPTADVPGLKPKDLIGIPWRVAFALQADGWWLRSEIPWIKRNAMPGSQMDRPTSATEKVFLLSKAKRYYWDMEAVKRQAVSDHGSGNDYKRAARLSYLDADGPRGNDEPYTPQPTRSLRDSDFFFDSLQAILDGGEGMLLNEDDEPLALVVNAKGYPGAHFATYPEALVEPCIKAGTSERGCCPVCGKPWERVVQKEFHAQPDVARDKGIRGAYDQKPTLTGWDGVPRGTTTATTLEWRPTCPHDADPIPCTVLDPFLGSGTTAVVARQLGRHCIGVEKSAEYLELARHRLNRTESVEIHDPAGDNGDTLLAEQATLWAT